MHMLKPVVAEKMRELIVQMEGERILEIGTGWGESAKFFSDIKPSWKVYTIDAFGLYGDGRIYSHWNHDAIKTINQGLGANVIQILANSSTVPWELPLDVLFIDGDHTYEGCKKDFERFSSFVRPGGLIIFDDYIQQNNPANGVKAFVDSISHSYNILFTGIATILQVK